MVLSPEMTVANVEDELPGVRAYAQRHGWSVEWTPEETRLMFLGVHPNSKDALRIVAVATDYRVLPPIWTIEDPTGQEPLSGFFPKGTKLPNGKSSIFHSKRVICAHFNRLAYKQHGGPHNDWGGPESWLEFSNKQQVNAFRLATMFAVIVAHLAASEGMH